MRPTPPPRCRPPVRWSVRACRSCCLLFACVRARARTCEHRAGILTLADECRKKKTVAKRDGEHDYAYGYSLGNWQLINETNPDSLDYHNDDLVPDD